MKITNPNHIITEKEKNIENISHLSNVDIVLFYLSFYNVTVPDNILFY